MGIPLIDGDVDFQMDADFDPMRIKQVSGGVAQYHLGADAQLDVRFFKKRLPSKTKSTSEALHFDEFDYISIQRPGDKSTKVVRRVRDGDKARFPLHWQRYMSGEKQVVGSPIERLYDMGFINESQLGMLKLSGANTVEQVAHASIGMVNGWGSDGVEIQNLAKGFVAEKERVEGEKKTITREAELLKRMAELEKKLEAESKDKSKSKSKSKSKASKKTLADIENEKITEELSEEGKNVLVVEG